MGTHILAHEQSRRAGASQTPRAEALPPGRALAPADRRFFESRLGHDLGQVRIHSGPVAARTADAVGARAFAVGNDVVLGRGTGRLDTTRGRFLLAHELAHVIQARLAASPAQHLGRREGIGERDAKRTVAGLGWGGMHDAYGTVASDVAWHASARAAPVTPRLSPARARVQRVELTYDDGPDSAGNTSRVLSALNTAGARATFYLVGKRVVQGDNWRVVFDIAAGGHWLGNHAYDWNDTTDNHVFLHGTAEARAQKILQTEWAIRDALTRGRDAAQAASTWDTIPAGARGYIEDVIAHGTGRFRTPGFRSHIWNDGATTMAAIASVNHVLAATGLRPLVITEVGWVEREGVTVDPQDWRAGRTRTQIESAVTGALSSDADSILLHSRLAATAAATPAIVSDIQARGFNFRPTAQGTIGSVGPRPGFAGLSTISDPPTSAQIATARAFLRRGIPGYGPVLAGGVALGILQLAQRAGTAEVNSFVAEIRATTVQTPTGRVPLANWLNANEEWRLFAGFFENWVTNRPFPRIPGVTL